MLSPDTRVYATVLHTDHTLQYSLTIAANVLATPINFLSFYLIIFVSKRESTSFKVCMFLGQFFFYIAQVHLGVLMGLVTLHPFPGVYCMGVLKNAASSFTHCFIWFLLFSSYVYVSFVQLVNRLRVVARPGKVFDQSNWTYSVVYTLLAVYIYVPFPAVLLVSNSSLENMKVFVKKHFPNNAMVFDNPGVFILTNPTHTIWNHAVMAFMVLSAVVFVILAYYFITKEIESSLESKSGPSTEEIRQNLNNYVLQSLTHVLFLMTSCGLILRTFFNDPSVDSRISNTIAFTCLCGASIPYQLLMISRNAAYREFVLKPFRRSTRPPTLYQQRVSVFS